MHSVSRCFPLRHVTLCSTFVLLHAGVAATVQAPAVAGGALGMSADLGPGNLYCEDDSTGRQVWKPLEMCTFFSPAF